MLKNKIFKKVFAIFSLVAILITTFIPQVSGAEPIKPTENTGPDCIGYIGFKKVSNPEKYDVRYVPYGSTTSKSKYPVYFLYSKADGKDIFCVDYGPVADSSNPLCKDATKSWLAQLDTTRENDLKTILSLSIHFARNGSYTHSSEINYAFTQMLVWDLCAQYGKAIGIPYKNTIGERISELYFEDTPTQQYYEKWRSQIVESVANYYAYPGSKLSQFESKYFVTDYKTASSKYLLKINTNVQLPSDTSPVEVVNSNSNTNFSQWSLFNSNSKVKYTHNTRLQLALYNQNDPLRGTEDLGLLVMNDRHPVKQFNNKWSGTHAYVGIYRSAKAQNQTVIKTEGVAFYLIPQTFKLTGQTKNIPEQKIEVKLKKIDARTRLPLKNVKFRIQGITNNFDRIFYTDDNGEIKLELAEGKYRAIEVETPEGYKAIKPVEFTAIRGKTEPIPVVIENEKDIIPDSGVLKIKKVDAKTKQKLTGAIFGIYESESSTTPVKTLYINSSGEGEARNLTLEKQYYLKEIKAPQGYLKSNKVIKFVINKTSFDETLNIALKEMTISNSKAEGRIIIDKVSTNGKKLKNAVFEIRKGKELVETLVTDANGRAISKYLPYGDYELYEKNSPEFYKKITIANNKVKIDSNSDYKVTVTNNHLMGSIELSKVDSKGNFLKDTKYVLYVPNTILEKYKSDVDLQKSYFTDKNINDTSKYPQINGYTPIVEKTTGNGVTKFDKLLVTNSKDNKYILKEIQAPNGYMIDRENVIVDLNQTENGKEDIVKKVKRTNYNVPENTPNTGTKGALIFLAVGSVLILSSFALKKKENIK